MDRAGKRRFEYVVGSSKKFWEAQLEGRSLTVRWGRIGATGQVKVKRFASPGTAAMARERLVQEKVRKGYVETGRGGGGNGKGRALSTPPSTGDPLARLDALWEAKRPELRRTLRKPASPRLLDELERAAHVPLPEPLRRFYAWHDGCRDEHMAVEGFFGWPSVTRVLAHKRVLDRMERDGFFADWASGQWWNSSWLPFLQFNNEDFVCLDLAGILGKGRGAVFVRRNADNRRVVLAPSFRKWLEQHIALTASGPTTNEEDEWIDYFVGRRASAVRARIAPGFPATVTARRA